MPHRDLHHENPHVARHREQLFQQFTADILRESRDQNSLRYAADRALSNPETRRDSQLETMIRSFIAERQAELEARLSRQREETSRSNPHSGAQAPSPDAATPAAMDESTRRQYRFRFERMDRDLAERLAHFDLAGATDLLRRLEDLQKQYPDIVRETEIQRRRMDYQKAVTRRAEIAAEIDALERDVIGSAEHGDATVTAALLKKLSAVHATRPEMLTPARLEQIRAKLDGISAQSESREALQALMARERSVAGEIRRLADAVHAFHLEAHGLPPDDPRYTAIEQNYFNAVREVRHHDRAWLADLMVELGDLAARIHEPSGPRSVQIDQFVERVRHAISHMVAEIRQIAADRKSENPGSA